MQNFIHNSVAVLLIIGGVYVVLGVIYFSSLFNQRKNQLPIDRNKLLRMPAQTLNAQVFDTIADMLGVIVVLTAILPLPFVVTGIKHFLPLSGPRITGLIVSLVALVFCLYKARKHMKQLIKLKLGRDAELATASELMKLQANGFQVFHDIQADGFNIDHLAVGSQGIFAIETKGRHKRKSDNTKNGKNFVVAYQNNQLAFPSWSEVEPLVQAERQAVWVNNWLKEATGLTHLHTVPVLCLPGWWVELRAKPPFPIVNHKQLHKTILSMRHCALSPAEISQISYQVVQRCTYGDK